MTVPAWVKASAASLGLGGAIGLFAALALVGGECSAWRYDQQRDVRMSDEKVIIAGGGIGDREGFAGIGRQPFIVDKGFAEEEGGIF